jgi:hypothetical protein
MNFLCPFASRDSRETAKTKKGDETYVLPVRDPIEDTPDQPATMKLRTASTMAIEDRVGPTGASPPRGRQRERTGRRRWPASVADDANRRRGPTFDQKV